MEIKLTEHGTFELLYDKFTVAIIVAVIVAGMRIGWVLMPWILGLGLLAFLFV